MFELKDSILIDNTVDVKAVGIGDGGCISLNRLINMGLNNVDFIAMNTDAQGLLKSLAPRRLQIGQKVTRGLGAGSHMEIGEQAAKESHDDILEVLGQPDMVFIIAGLGGGTGSGAVPMVASLAKNAGALTVAIVTLPFSIEGTFRKKRAEESLAKLKECADAVVVINNDRLLSLEKNTKDSNSNFDTVDQIIAEVIQGIVNLIAEPGLICLDFSDVSLILKDAGAATVGVGTGTGEKAAMEAMEKAAAFTLFDESINDAKSIIINITGSDEKLSMYEVNEAVDVINKMTSGNVNIIWGVSVDNNLGDTVKATVIASGFDASENTGGMLSGKKENNIESRLYKQMVETCVKKMQDSATTVAESIDLMRELRVMLKEISEKNLETHEW